MDIVGGKTRLFDSRGAGPARREPAVIALVSGGTAVELRTLASQTGSQLVLVRSRAGLFDQDRAAGTNFEAGVVVIEASAGMQRVSDWHERTLPLVAHLPLIVRCDLSDGAARDVLALAHLARAYDLKWRVSLIGFDDLATDLRAALAWAPLPDAHAAILSEVAPRIDRDIAVPVTAVVLLARGRINVALLSQACRMANSTLRAHLRRHAAPAPRQLLHAVVVLHSVWRLEVLGLTPQEAAHLAGYGKSARPEASLSEFVWRNVGHRPKALRARRSFATLLDQFADRLRRSSLPASNAEGTKTDIRQA